MSIYSLQIEKHVIAGLIKHPKVFTDVAVFITDKDFYSEVHAISFCVIRDSVLKGEKIDKVLIAQKIKNLGVSFKDDIDIFDYIDSICFTQISAEATFEACQELVKVRIRRELYETGEKLQKHAKASGKLSVDELISSSDSIYSEKISALSSTEDPVNLFEGIEDFVENRGNNPVEETGYLTPYPNFNRLFGGLRNSNIYAFVARPGQGKSSVLSDICFKTSLLSNFKIKALILDTEMETEDIKWRMVSSLSGVPMWYLETGNWRKNEEMVTKVRDALKLIKNYEYYHYKVGNKTIDQVCSLARRWRFSKVGRNEPVIIAYDYIKLTGEKISESWKEHQVVGEKTDKLKKLSEELICPMLVAMQLNRSAESKNKKASDVADDSSAIATSDRLQWFASYVGIFRTKTLDEIAEDGIEFGSHKLIDLKTRFQGKDAQGHQNLVKRKLKDGSVKFCANYLNFDVSNFCVTEKGTLQDIINRDERELSKPSEEDGETEL